MKKFYQAIGLLSLLCFSFILTDKTAEVIKNMDDIMITIKDQKKNYQTRAVDAVIKDDSIIPGISAREVSTSESYRKMKEYGKYNPNLFVYKYTLPNISVENNKDKYIISGNKEKRMVSLNFIIDDESEIDNIIDILESNQVLANFFVTDSFLSNNLELTYHLILEGYNFGIGINQPKNYKWMNTIITKVGKQDNIYCLYQNKNTSKYCKKLNGYTIKGYTIDNNYYNMISKEIESGSIFNLKVNDELDDSLDLIIKYIKKKGYNITNLDEHIKE